MNWIKLKDSKQIDELRTASFERAKIIFKHSTRCIISKMALRNFESDFNENIPADSYLLDLITYREISNYISECLNIRHESPQVLLVKNGEVIYHESHEGINAKEIELLINK